MLSRWKLGHNIPIIRRYKELPYTKVLVWLTGGSSIENKDEQGYAHFIEHLFFKLRVDGLGLADFVEGLGGYTNAYTSHDDIVVEITVTNENVKESLIFLSKIMRTSLKTISHNDFAEA